MYCKLLIIVYITILWGLVPCSFDPSACFTMCNYAFNTFSTNDILVIIILSVWTQLISCNDVIYRIARTKVCLQGLSSNILTRVASDKLVSCHKLWNLLLTLSPLPKGRAFLRRL